MRTRLALAALALSLAAGLHAEPDARGAILLASPDTGANKTAFGAAVAVLDFNGDGEGDIAVGDPSETRNGVTQGIVRIYLRQQGQYQAAFQTELIGVDTRFGATLAVADFDEDGRDDLLIGASGFGNGGGAVYLLRHADASTIVRENLILNADASGGRCGASLAVGDFDNDGLMDFAAGCPEATVEGIVQAGRVQVGRGNPNGLFSMTSISQQAAGVGGGSETGDGFGFSLAAGDFDCNFGPDDLAIGAPFETVDGATENGAVHVLYGQDDLPLSGAGSQLWHQGVADVPGNSGAEDHFGWSLAAGDFNRAQFALGECEDLAIGIPDDAESAGGRVLVLNGSGDGLVAAGARLLSHVDFPTSPGPGGTHTIGLVLGSARLGGDSAAELLIHAEGEQEFLSNTPGLVCVARGASGSGLAGHRCYGPQEFGLSVESSFGRAFAVGQLTHDFNQLVIGSLVHARAIVVGDRTFGDGFEGNPD